MDEAARQSMSPPGRSGAWAVWMGLAWVSVALLVIGVFSPWETGRVDIQRPGPHVTTSAWDSDGATLLVAPAVAAIALALVALLRHRRVSRAVAVLVLLAGSFMALLTLAELSMGPIGCDEFLGPVCQEGEAAIVVLRWGCFLTMAASFVLVLASLMLVLRPGRMAGHR